MKSIIATLVLLLTFTASSFAGSPPPPAAPLILYHADVTVVASGGKPMTTSLSFANNRINDSAASAAPIDLSTFGTCVLNFSIHISGNFITRKNTMSFSITKIPSNAQNGSIIYQASLPLSLGKNVMLLKTPHETVSVKITKEDKPAPKPKK